MAGTEPSGSRAPSEERFPIPSGEPETNVEKNIEQLLSKIQALEQQLIEKANNQTEDPYKLKPIDIKDIEKNRQVRPRCY